MIHLNDATYHSCPIQVVYTKTTHFKSNCLQKGEKHKIYFLHFFNHHNFVNKTNQMHQKTKIIIFY